LGSKESTLKFGSSYHPGEKGRGKPHNIGGEHKKKTKSNRLRSELGKKKERTRMLETGTGDSKKNFLFW